MRCGSRRGARAPARRCARCPGWARCWALGLFGHNALVYLAIALVPAVWWLLFRTRFGLRLRATGENPAMVDAAGVSVTALRYRALMLNGVLCSLAGSYLVLAQNPSFMPNMTAGRGYMALAAMIFGKWHPVGAFFACLLFGFLDAVSIRLQGTTLPLIGTVPVQAVQALPYVMTVVLLAGFVGRARRQAWASLREGAMMDPPPGFAHSCRYANPLQGQHQRPGKAGSAVFLDWGARTCL